MDQFSWFASTYDTGDWVYRLTTMLQMVGVLILTLGIPQVFSSIADGEHVNNRAMVAGYVVMRVGMVIQRLRAARQDPDRRSACLTYASTITVAQIGWKAVLMATSLVGVTFALIAVMSAIELMGPLLAEKRMGGTPWHAHHIVERNGLLMIIALGQGVVGTVASLIASDHSATATCISCCCSALSWQPVLGCTLPRITSNTGRSWVRLSRCWRWRCRSASTSALSSRLTCCLCEPGVIRMRCW
jgi:low temperature requirement protein LtrA